jgi:uncharacterized membrane protein
VLAINVGGALIPIALSLYLIVKHQLFGLSVIGVAIVAAVCHLLARPVPEPLTGSSLSDCSRSSTRG